MKYIFSLIFFASLTNHIMAQEGKFLDAYFFGHQTSINNQYDLRYGAGKGLGRAFSYNPTYTYGGAIYYARTFETLVGLKTGLVYANYFQKISSSVTLSRNDTLLTPYTSSIKHRLLSIPILIDFGINATDDDRVFFHMAFGLQPMILLGGKYEIEQNGNYSVSYNYNIYDYYRPLSIAYVLNTELKIRLGKTDKLYLCGGIDFNKTIGGVEFKKTDHGGTLPRELVFPLGTLKDYDYDVPEERQLMNTKNESIAIRIGISKRLST